MLCPSTHLKTFRAPNTKASLSSVTTPSTSPCRSSQAHCASASDGATTYGSPNSCSSSWTSPYMTSVGVSAAPVCSQTAIFCSQPATLCSQTEIICSQTAIFCSQPALTGKPASHIAARAEIFPQNLPFGVSNTSDTVFILTRRMTASWLSIRKASVHGPQGYVQAGVCSK
jgi:hypothetical protein